MDYEVETVKRLPTIRLTERRLFNRMKDASRYALVASIGRRAQVCAAGREKTNNHLSVRYKGGSLVEAVRLYPV